jgi:hypothetical protein
VREWFLVTSLPTRKPLDTESSPALTDGGLAMYSLTVGPRSITLYTMTHKHANTVA